MLIQGVQLFYNYLKSGGSGRGAGDNNENKRVLTISYYYFVNSFTFYSRTKKTPSIS